MLVFIPVIGLGLAILGIGAYVFLPLLLPIVMTTLPADIAIPPIPTLSPRPNYTFGSLVVRVCILDKNAVTETVEKKGFWDRVLRRNKTLS